MPTARIPHPWVKNIRKYMGHERNPLKNPDWYSIGREIALVRHLIGSGVTALGHANYADQVGQYYIAFFNLSIGLERLAKLVLVADYAISNGGKMPEQKIVRQFGHRLGELFGLASGIAEKHLLKLHYNNPVNAISQKITKILDSFADARRGRYANFASLGDPSLGKEEPIGKWWNSVAELILKHHYYGSETQHRVEAKARLVDSQFSSIAIVLHTNENGDMMRDILSASIRSGQTEVVQKYGRYYTLLLVRWLSDVFCEISKAACYKSGCDAFFGAWECVQSYVIEDSFLKRRKVWPLS